MALPIAQLGYMPNVSAPSARPRYEVRNPWEDLAMGILTNVASGAIGNLMQRDYATQATTEVPHASVGQPISPETGQPVGPAMAPEPIGPTNAPWWSKMLQGPQMGAGQYGQVLSQRAQAAEGEAGRTFQGGENAANRTLTTAENAADRELKRKQIDQAAQEFAQGYDLNVDQYNLQKQIAEGNLQQGERALGQGDTRLDTIKSEGAADRASRERTAAMGSGRVPAALLDAAVSAETRRRLMAGDMRGLTVQEITAIYRQLEATMDAQAPEVNVRF